ncbi:MAG: hypothetical protein ACM3Y9_05905 [Ignavibacteria bacterium]
MSDPRIEEAVRRSVALAALRRLGRMANAERAQDAEQARWATRLSWTFAAAALLALAWLAFR